LAIAPSACHGKIAFARHTMQQASWKTRRLLSRSGCHNGKKCWTTLSKRHAHTIWNVSERDAHALLRDFFIDGIAKSVSKASARD
jgi:hypothetical protein